MSFSFSDYTRKGGRSTDPPGTKAQTSAEHEAGSRAVIHSKRSATGGIKGDRRLKFLLTPYLSCDS